MTLKLRPATVADAGLLTEIRTQAKAGWGYPDDKMADYRRELAANEADIASKDITIAEVEGVPVAFLGTEKQDDKLLIDTLFVSPSAQGRGIGHLLVTRAEDKARTHNLTTVTLVSDYHAAPFYERRGFATVATEPSRMAPQKALPVMEKHLPNPVNVLTGIDLTVTDTPWAFEIENQQAIDAHFKEAQRRNPHLWNGQTLKLAGYTFEDGVFSGKCVHCSFAAYLAWRDWGAPDPTAFNLFGSAILRSADNALLYGLMSQHTATAGLIYPPGGNLEPKDIAENGKVDVEASIYRELAEETGLERQDVTEGGLYIIFDGPRISIARVFDCGRTAANLRQAVLEHSLASQEQELADVRIFRSPDDLNAPAIIPYARALGRHLLS